MRLNLFNTIAPLFAIAAFAVIPVAAQDNSQTPSQAGSEIRAENCMVQYINKVNVPAKAEGILLELNIEEGDTVDEDDLIAVIDDTAAELALELKKAEEKEAILNAANDVNLKDAKNSEELASAEYKAYQELRREGAIPYWEMEKKRLEAERARLRIDLAEMQMKIAEVQMIAKRREREIAEFELTRRRITAPKTGFIEARIAQLGEWVQAGSPLATLIQMDKLRVEGDIDALRYPGQVLQGTPVQVLIYSGAKEPIKVNAKLGFVSMEIDLNNRHRVWVEVENRKVGNDWAIKPGMRADIVIPKTGEIF